MPPMGSKAQARVTYRVSSPSGKSAIQERIAAVLEQQTATDNAESIRIYEGVIVRLRAVLIAGASGVLDGDVLGMQISGPPMSSQHLGEAMDIFRGHMMLVMNGEAERRKTKSPPLKVAVAR